MVGLLNENRARPDDEDDIDPKQVRAEMNLPPDLQAAYEKVVVAGMKMMFSKETNKDMLKALESPDPMSQKLGEGVATLMLAMFMQSNQTMPPQVIIPAGIELVVQAADFIRKSGLGKVTNKDVGDGIQLMMSIVFKAFNVDPDKLFQSIDQADPNQIAQLATQQQSGQLAGMAQAQQAPAQGMQQQAPMPGV